jgi:membrane protease YdiL (CAAX protease family)
MIKDTHDPVNDIVPSYPDRREQLWELAAFLFLIVPSMALSFFAVRHGSISFVFIAVSTMLRDFALVSLILFFLWRNRERIAAIGWIKKDVFKEISLGIVLFIPFTVGASVLENILRSAGLSAPSAPLPALTSEKGITEYLLAFLMVIVVAVTEETIFRGYLMLRFRAITSSPAAAVLLSAVVFSIGHGYEGAAGVITVGVIGAVFAVIYLWRNSLAAPVTMHFLQDFIGIVLVPLLQQLKFIH